MGPSICVIGGGVAGLHAAYYIQNNIPNADLTIIADKFGKDTLSSGAGGMIGVTRLLKAPYPGALEEWADEAYKHYNNLHNSPEGGVAGISVVPVYFLSNKGERFVKNDLWDSVYFGSRSLSQAEKDLFGSWTYGSFTKAFVLDTLQYINWITDKIKSRGCRMMERRISSLAEIGKEYDIIINSTGLLAKFLCNDDSMVPVRGQVFKVKAPWIKQCVYAETDTYILPGPNVVTVGGCRKYNSWDETLNKHDSNDIWERCTKLLPSLKQAEIVEEWVGLRPHREPVRVEAEIIGKMRCVHHYGHGAYGWSSSPGSAKTVARIVKDMIASDAVLARL